MFTLEKVEVNPDQIKEQLGLEVEGSVSGHSLKGVVTLMDPEYPLLFGLRLKAKGEQPHDTEGQIQLG